MRDISATLSTVLYGLSGLHKHPQDKNSSRKGLFGIHKILSISDLE